MNLTKEYKKKLKEYKKKLKECLKIN